MCIDDPWIELLVSYQIESQIITDLGSPAMVLTDLVEQLAALLGAVAKGDVAAVSRFPAWRYWGEPERAPHLREVRHRCLYVYIYIYIFIYMCRTSCRIVLFTQNGQDGRPLRRPLRATQILATDSFKREGNRTTRSGNSKLSPRQGHRHRTKE